MKPIQIISQDLFDKIRSRFSNLEMGDENGAVVTDPADARFFDFDFVLEGTNLGRVSISINDAGSLKVYYSQGITENQDDPAKKEWFGFLREMRMFAMRRLLRFDTRDIAKTNLDKNDFQHLAQTQGPKEEEDMTTMNESRWSQKSSKKTSRAVKGTTEVIVRHARPVDEMFAGARSQRKNIKAIFIQNKDGERFKYPFIHPAGAFAMAQHVDHGGVPHDPAGKAIIKMSEDIAQLQEFQRTINRSTLHPEAHGIAERAIGRMHELKAQVEALGKRHHYQSWMESFQPDPMADSMPEMDAVAMEEYKQKFTQTNFQEELAGYFPLLHRIMSETNTIDLEAYVQEGIGGEFTVCANDGTYEIEKFTTLDDAMDYIKQTFHDDPRSRQMDYSIKDSTGNTVWSQDEDHDAEYDAYKERGWNQESAFEEWAESIESNELTPDQVDLLKQAIADQQSTGQQLALGPNGQTAWDFFSGAINPDDAEGSMGASFPSDLENKFKIAADEFPDMDAMDVFAEWAKEDYPELLTVLGIGSDSAEQPPAPAPEAPAPAPEEVPPAPEASTVPPVPAEEPMPPVPTMENDEMDGKPNELMTKEGMIKEIAKLVKSRYNRDNPDVGPFNGKENIALDVKKSIAEKFGDKAGEQAEGLALQFMEKLSDKWAEKHGKVEHDGLARLKELIGNLRGKIESVGDVGGHPGKNIMPAEETEMDEVAPYVPGGAKDGIPGNVPIANKIPPTQDNPTPIGSDVADKNYSGKEPNLAQHAMNWLKGKKELPGTRTFEELDTIRKLSGLGK